MQVAFLKLVVDLFPSEILTSIHLVATDFFFFGYGFEGVEWKTSISSS